MDSQIAEEEDVQQQLSTREWLQEEPAEEEEYQIEEYDLTSAPNDFNISTIFNFIESGAIKIPGFQRNYVWDIKRASKLIESIIIGLPVPQIFLYEEDRNSFLVIDGQQRLMSIYYFMMQRFPRKEKRTELRRIFDAEGQIPPRVLHNDDYFLKFDLRLPRLPSGKKNKFTGLNYSTLDDYRRSFDLRTIRNVIVKQISPRDDSSSIYELFNRLNSGGMNLEPQEIRTSLYHSLFYDMLFRVNTIQGWRRIIGVAEPDLHMKDIEILLRSFAMLVEGDNYRSSMTKFLDTFSKMMKPRPLDRVEYFEQLFRSFVRAASNLPAGAFHSDTNKFNISVFESVFAAVCAPALERREEVQLPIDREALAQLRSDPEFVIASQRQTTNKANVQMRLQRAKIIFSAL